MIAGAMLSTERGRTIVSALAGHRSAAVGASVTLAWSPSLSSGVAGNKLHYGTQAGNYDQVLDVGTQTSATASNLNPGIQYFFAATAYDSTGNESSFSNEVAYRPASPTPGPTGTPEPSPTASPPRTPSPTPQGGPSVTSVILVRNNPPGQLIQALSNGSVINTATLPTQNVNVQAFISVAGTASVGFFLDNIFSHTELTAPYAMCGDWDSCPANTILAQGSHTLTIQASNAVGVIGPQKIIAFTVVSSTQLPTATPRPTLTPAPTMSPSPVPTVPPSPPSPSPSVSPAPSASPTPCQRPTPPCPCQS